MKSVKEEKTGFSNQRALIGAGSTPSRLNLMNGSQITLVMDGLTLDYLMNEVFRRALNNPNNSKKDRMDIILYRNEFKRQIQEQA